MKRFKKREIPPLDTLKDEQYVNEYVAATIMGVSVGWVRKQREKRTGPPFMKLGSNVRYSVRAIHEWMQKQMVVTE